MEIKKHFSDIGSIVKTLIKTIDMSKVHIQIVSSNLRPGEIIIWLVSNQNNTILAHYIWQPLMTQNISIPDDLCMPHLLQKKIRPKKTIATKNRCW